MDMVKRRYMFGDYCACIKCDRDLSEVIRKRIEPAGSSGGSSGGGGGGSGGGGGGGGGGRFQPPPRAPVPRSKSTKRKSDDFEAPQTKRRPSTSSSGGGGGAVKCKCSVDAASFVTQKEGPNKGRAFFTRANNKQCNFFEWADEQRASRPSTSQPSSSNTSKPKGTRKAPTCSQCGQSGHTKRTCNKRK